MSLLISYRPGAHRSDEPRRASSVDAPWLTRILSKTALLCVFILGCDPPPPREIIGDSSVQATAQSDAEPEEMGDAQADERSSCEPQCLERSCGDDGCGGECGQCADGERCVERSDESRACAASEEDQGVSSSAGEDAACSPTCEESGDECGVRCGASCGSCDSRSRCESGRCVCTPQCAGQTCGADDGCGGRCEPCPRISSCAECVLRLEVVSQSEITQVASTALVVLSVHLPPQATPPEVAEFRFRLSGPAILGRVGVGSAVVSSGKQLVPDPATGLPYRVDGEIYSVVLLSTQNTDPITSGEWLYLDLQVSDTSSEPVTLSLIKREQTFAPPSADLILWGEEYTDQVVIWPALRGQE